MSMTSKDIEDLPDDLCQYVKRELGLVPKDKAKRNKYGAKSVVIDGHRFDSKAESKYYLRLLLLKKAGHIKYFLIQVPFHLPGGVRYLVDFQVFHTDGTIEYIDVKGVRTALFIAKKKLVESLYPVKIKEVE